MVFLSKVSISPRSGKGPYDRAHFEKLKDPHARSFTHVELRDAMMETIKTMNKLCKDAGNVCRRSS